MKPRVVYRRRMAVSGGLFGPLPRSHRPAFSLVELGVIGAIGILLFAIVGPSLQVARNRSKHSVCTSRLGTIGQATRIYIAEDPNGWSIPVHATQFSQDPNDPVWVGPYEWGGKSGIGATGFVIGPTGYYAYLTSRYGTKAGFGPSTRPLNSILYPLGFKDSLNTSTGWDRNGCTSDTKLSLDAYRCPADDGAPGAAHCPDWIANPNRSSYDHFGTSFSANTFCSSYVGGGPVYSNSPYLRPVSRVPNPARTIRYEENIGRFAWNCRNMAPKCESTIPGLAVDPGPTKAVRGWHGRNWTFNRAFVDGHVATQKVFIEGTEDSAGYSQHYRIELVFPDDPERQNTSACIIIRGDGWQIDTLPAEGIFTGLAWNGYGRVSTGMGCGTNWGDKATSSADSRPACPGGPVLINAAQ